MATISELVAKHSKVPGDIRVTHSQWSELPAHNFTPYFCDRFNWYGLQNDDEVTGDMSRWNILDDDWELYTEPKPKVKRWLWADKDGCTTRKMYTEKELVEVSKSWTIKLAWSETEFPE